MGEIKTEEEEKCQMGEKRRKATVRRQSKDGEKGRLSFNRVQSFDYFIKHIKFANRDLRWCVIK